MRFLIHHELADYLREELGFPGARQAARLRRMEKTDLTIATGELAQERWYLLTRLPPGRCSPDDLLRLFRGHWSIENSLHHVKDRSWDEDRHTLRRPGLGEVFAVLVNVSRHVLRQEGWFPERMSLPLRAKTCAFRPSRTIARLFGKPS